MRPRPSRHRRTRRTRAVRRASFYAASEPRGAAGGAGANLGSSTSCGGGGCRCARRRGRPWPASHLLGFLLRITVASAADYLPLVLADGGCRHRTLLLSFALSKSVIAFGGALGNGQAQTGKANAGSVPVKRCQGSRSCPSSVLLDCGPLRSDRSMRGACSACCDDRSAPERGPGMCMIELPASPVVRQRGEDRVGRSSGGSSNFATPASPLSGRRNNRGRQNRL
jgi:hypothetical protein